MYGSSLILLPDDCDLLVKRWRKKEAVPAPTPVPPQPQPAPVSSKGFKQKQSTYRLSVAPSGRARCRRCRTVIAKGETRLEVCAFVRPGRYTMLLRCTAPACIFAGWCADSGCRRGRSAVIFGPDDTPWEGGTFKLSLTFTEDYPNKAPQVKFITKMFHPNIYADGAICLDILQNQWSPIYDISAILTSIQSLLTDPNPQSPANSEASKLYVENKGEYNRRVKAVVEESWKA